MKQITVGIGEYAVSNNKDEVLKTYALGSCVSVIIYDTRLHIAGLIHIALPESKIDPQRALEKPAYYADTGLPVFIEAMKWLGAQKEYIWIKLAGGTSTMNAIDSFDIGKRNVLAIRKYLWKYALGPIREDVGGNMCRTVTFSVATGEVILSSGSRKWEL